MVKEGKGLFISFLPSILFVLFIFDFVLIRENTGHGKPVFSHTLSSVCSYFPQIYDCLHITSSGDFCLPESAHSLFMYNS